MLVILPSASSQKSLHQVQVDGLDGFRPLDSQLFRTDERPLKMKSEDSGAFLFSDSPDASPDGLDEQFCFLRIDRGAETT